MENVGLVLEGGGLRGVYTSGVLDFFMDKNLYIPNVYGVSMGACNAASYISKQRGRNKKAIIDYIRDPRYLSIRNLLKEKSLFGMKFIFDEIPNKLVPFDNDTFNNSKEKLTIAVTDCVSGKPAYFTKNDGNDILTVIQASSSLPFISKTVKIGEGVYLDGGVSDPIPIHKSIEDGNTKNIVVLTRNPGYRKKQSNYKRIGKRFYPDYSGLLDALDRRYTVYNDDIDYIEKLEKEKSVFIIRPEEPLKVKRIDKNQKKLEKLYEEGYKDAEKCYEKLKEFLGKESK